MKAPATLLTATLLFAGGCCTPAYYWYHPDRTLERAKQDHCLCRCHARQEASEAVADEYLDRASSPRHLGCSYSAPHDDVGLGADPLDAWLTRGQVYQGNVFAGCMKRKGYQRLKARRLPSNARTNCLSMGAVAGR